MRIISRKELVDFWEQHEQAEQPLRAWYAEAQRADWKTPQQIKARYQTASILADNRVVFNISGNAYRLVVKIHYNTGVLYIRFVGTHAQYDRINAETI